MRQSRARTLAHVADESTTSLGPTDYLLGLVCGLVGLATTMPIVLAARPGYLSCTDCVPYVIQAHTFASGHLTRPAPPEALSPFYQTLGMLESQGREFSRQPPGASALFALLMSIVPDVRLTPPVVTALTLAMTFLWVCRAYDRRIALTTVSVCLLGSVHYMVISCSCLSYPPSGLFFAAGMLMLTFVVSRASILAALACGVFIGLQFTVRPFTAVLISVGLAFIRLGTFRKRPRTLLQCIAFAAGFFVGVVLLLTHNRLVTQNFWPLAFSLSEPNDRLGFGLRGWGPILHHHTFGLALRNLLSTFHELCMGFLRFYILLIPVYVWWLSLAVNRGRSARGRLTRWDASLIILIAVVIVGHMAYWCPRPINYFETYPLFAVLISRGIWYIVGHGRAARYAIPVALALLIGFMTVSMTLWIQGAASPAVTAIHDEIDRTHRDRGRLLLFIEGVDRLGEKPPALRGNDLSMPRCFNLTMSPEEPVLFAIDRGPYNRRLIAQYPDRHPCILRDSHVIPLHATSTSASSQPR